MKVPTKKQRQWLWFVGLWCIGLLATAGLSYLFRWIVAV